MFQELDELVRQQKAASAVSGPQQEVYPQMPPTIREPIQAPSMIVMAGNIAKAASKWAGSRFVSTDEATLETRLEACRGCEFWSPVGFGGTGRCMKCGCSTWAKLRMATEKCPVGKW